MNKHNLMRRVASVATELDVKGFTKEAKELDSILLKLANSAMEFDDEYDRGVRDVIRFYREMGEDEKKIKTLISTLSNTDFRSIMKVVGDSVFIGKNKIDSIDDLIEYVKPREDEFDEADMYPYMGDSGYDDGDGYGNQEYHDDY